MNAYNSKKSECIGVFYFYLFLARFETFLKWRSVMFTPAIGLVKKYWTFFVHSKKELLRLQRRKTTLQGPFSSVLQVCWLAGGWRLKHSTAVTQLLGPAACLQRLGAQRARLLCLQPLQQTLPQVSQICPFSFYPWSFLLCVNDHHLTGFVNVIQLVS